MEGYKTYRHTQNPKENRRYCFKTFCKRVEMHNLK